MALFHIRQNRAAIGKRLCDAVFRFRDPLFLHHSPGFDFGVQQFGRAPDRPLDR